MIEMQPQQPTPTQCTQRITGRTVMDRGRRRPIASRRCKNMTTDPSGKCSVHRSR
jgi:hypothetical protein